MKDRIVEDKESIIKAIGEKRYQELYDMGIEAAKQGKTLDNNPNKGTPNIFSKEAWDLGFNSVKTNKMTEQLNEVKRMQQLANIAVLEEAANTVDSIPEIQAYLKNLALNMPKVKGIDTNEVKMITKLLDLVISKIGKGSIAPSIAAATDVISRRTQALK